MADGVAMRLNADPVSGLPVYDAAHERYFGAVAMAPSGRLTARPGRRPGPGLELTIGGAPEAVTMQPGVGVITGPTDSVGSYRFAIPAAVTKNFPARPAGGTSRIDRLIVRVYDEDVAAMATVLREVDVELISGAAGASPTAPAIPDWALVVGGFTVPATGGISIDSSVQKTVAAGGILPVKDSTERDAIINPYDGLMVYRADTLGYEGRINGAWVPISGAFATWVPVFSAGGTPITLGNGTLSAHRTRIGDLVFFSATLVVGSTTNLGAGAWTCTVPIPFAGPTRVNGTAHTTAPNSGQVWFKGSGTGLAFYQGAGTAVVTVANLGLITGTTFQVSGCYQAA